MLNRIKTIAAFASIISLAIALIIIALSLNGEQPRIPCSEDSLRVDDICKKIPLPVSDHNDQYVIQACSWSDLDTITKFDLAAECTKSLRFDCAMQCYENIAKSENGITHIWVQAIKGKADLEVDNAHADEALEIYDTLLNLEKNEQITLKFDTEKIPIWVGQANAYYYLDPVLAVERYKKVLEIRPMLCNALNGLGNTYVKLFDPNEAKKQFTECLRIAKDELPGKVHQNAIHNAKVGLAGVLVKEGDILNANKLYDEVLDEHHNKISALLGRAAMYEQDEDNLKAKAEYNKILNLSENIHALVGLGNILVKESKYVDAIPHFERALDLMEEDPRNDEYPQIMTEVKETLSKIQ